MAVEDRRQPMSDADVDAIVQKVIDKVAAEVGKSIMRKALWVVGIGVLALGYWLRDHGWFK